MPTRVNVIANDFVTRIRFETESGIHILSSQTRRELARAIQLVNRDTNCRVVVFEAQGRTFLAGAELAELQALTDVTAKVYALGGQELMNSVAKLKPVTICAIQAACAGGGCELALACDLRLAATGARIGLPEVSLGLIPGWGGTVRATKLLGPAVARRVILTGTLFPAIEALQLGLVDTVFPNETFSTDVDAFVKQQLTRGPAAVRRAKKAISQFGPSKLKAAFRREAQQFAACYTTGEPEEGIRAFLEKRPPVWPEVVAIPEPTVEDQCSPGTP